MSAALDWPAFCDARPDLAEAGRGLFYQFGVGLAFLATVRRDGGPRLNPVCPIITDQGLFAFIVPSPKRADLFRDGRYRLHSFPAAENEDAFMTNGLARHVSYHERRAPVEAQFTAERGGTLPMPLDDQELFEFTIDSCVLTRTTGHGDPDPQHTVWRVS